MLKDLANMGVRSSMSIVRSQFRLCFRSFLTVLLVYHDIWRSMGLDFVPFLRKSRHACFVPCQADASPSQRFSIKKHREAELCSASSHA